MSDDLSRLLGRIATDHRARAMRSPGSVDPSGLSEVYLAESMVLLDAAYGRECAERVRATATTTTPAAVPTRAVRAVPGALDRCLRRHLEACQQEWLQTSLLLPRAASARGRPALAGRARTRPRSSG